jgi:uncharacterized PurR-regulated membrane protein YhhQ (DUF165 family)
MTHRMLRRRATLRHWRNFLGGTLIGAAAQTPVFAATDFTNLPNEWSARLAHGDWMAWAVVAAIVLIILGVALSVFARHTPRTSPPSPDSQNSIGRHRPQIYH